MCHIDRGFYAVVPIKIYIALLISIKDIKVNIRRWVYSPEVYNRSRVSQIAVLPLNEAAIFLPPLSPFLFIRPVIRCLDTACCLVVLITRRGGRGLLQASILAAWSICWIVGQQPHRPHGNSSGQTALYGGRLMAGPPCVSRGLRTRPTNKRRSTHYKVGLATNCCREQGTIVTCYLPHCRRNRRNVWYNSYRHGWWSYN